MSKFAGFIFCGALLFAAGCTTTPDAPVPVEWTATNAVPNTLIIHTNRQFALIAKTNLPPFVVSNKSVALAFPVNVLPPIHTNQIRSPAPVLTWTSMSRWAAEHKLEKPRLVYNSPVSTYALVAGNNLMTLSIGSHEASWNGIGINLGFEPEMIDGEIFLHQLDLQKNLEPLFCGEPLKFSNNGVIVLDPGHGGMNGGTISVLDKRPEKEFTLDLAKRIKPLLEQEGWKVFLTRTNDYDVALSNRVAFAEFHHADLFISLHFNSSAPDKKQSGLETYCLTPTGMPSTITRGFADPWSENLPNNDYDAPNLQLAVRLHKALLHASGETDRGVRRARFIGVLRGQKRPAILIEAGYLSNPHEAEMIEDPNFRQQLAAAVAAALKPNAEARIPKPEVTTHTNLVAP